QVTGQASGTPQTGVTSYPDGTTLGTGTGQPSSTTVGTMGPGGLGTSGLGTGGSGGPATEATQFGTSGTGPVPISQGAEVGRSTAGRGNALGTGTMEGGPGPDGIVGTGDDLGVPGGATIGAGLNSPGTSLTSSNRFGANRAPDIFQNQPGA